jgi:hypothetical protein
VGDFFLSAADKCDAQGCPARAYVRVVLTPGELLFCNHHGHQYEARLREVALMLFDESSRVDVKLDASA